MECEIRYETYTRSAEFRQKPLRNFSDHIIFDTRIQSSVSSHPQMLTETNYGTLHRAPESRASAAKTRCRAEGTDRVHAQPEYQPFLCGPPKVLLLALVM